MLKKYKILQNVTLVINGKPKLCFINDIIEFDISTKLGREMVNFYSAKLIKEVEEDFTITNPPIITNPIIIEPTITNPVIPEQVIPEPVTPEILTSKPIDNDEGQEAEVPDIATSEETAPASKPLTIPATSQEDSSKQIENQQSSNNYDRVSVNNDEDAETNAAIAKHDNRITNNTIDLQEQNNQDQSGINNTDELESAVSSIITKDNDNNIQNENNSISIPGDQVNIIDETSRDQPLIPSSELGNQRSENRSDTAKPQSNKPSIIAQIKEENNELLDTGEKKFENLKNQVKKSTKKK